MHERRNSLFDGNVADVGGAVYGSGYSSIADSMLRNCSASSLGACVYSASSMTIATTRLQNTTVPADGGVHVIHHASEDDDVRCEFDRVAFAGISGPAIASQSLVVLRNVDGLHARDVADVASVMTCAHADISEYCALEPPERCSPYETVTSIVVVYRRDSSVI